MSEMEWEGPIPVWIESIAIDMDDELPSSDLLINIPDVRTPKTHSFLSCDSKLPIPDSSFSMTFEVQESPVKTKATATAPSLSPTKSKQETAKPPRRTRRKVDVDPSGRTLRRKTKQRGYEKGYRSRQKQKRGEDAAEWISLEIQVRNLLAKRSSVLVLGALQESDSTVSVRQRYMELLQEERALKEAQALDGCVLAAEQAMGLWGGTTAASRETRGQVNALPSLRSCLMFDFQW